MESQSEGFPDAQAPGRPAECVSVCAGHHKAMGCLLYGVPKRGGPGRPGSRAPSRVCVCVCVLDTIREGGGIIWNPKARVSRTPRFPGAQPSVCVCAGHHKERGCLLYGVPKRRFPGRPGSRPPSLVFECVLDAIRQGGVYYIESRSEGFPDARAPGRPAECVCVCDEHHKGRGCLLYGVPKRGFPGRPGSRAPSRVCLCMMGTIREGGV